MKAWREFLHNHAVRERICLVAAPAALCVVAALQIARVWWLDQTPWKGGGFGMFASIDDGDARFVKIYLITNKGELPGSVPHVREAGIVRTVPSAENLDDLALLLARTTWVRGGGAKAARALVEGEQLQASEAPVEFCAIRVELWRSSFVSQSNQIRASKFREAIKPKTGV